MTILKPGLILLQMYFFVNFLLTFKPWQAFLVNVQECV